MLFQALADGKPVVPRHHELAWSGTSDLTADLLRMGVPVFASIGDAPEMLGRLPDQIKRELAMQQLVSGDGDWILPNWDYQSVYEWQQSFAPGETEIAISYKPILGYPDDMDPRGLSDELKQAYCVPGNFLEAHAQRASMVGAVAVLGYIANEMSGPIGEFHLKIDQGADTLAALCVPPRLTATDRPLQWAAKDFTPSNGLKVLFLVP